MDLLAWWKRLKRQVQAADCYNCRFSETFRSTGDGQVSRLHTFCHNPASPHHQRPIPAERICDDWRPSDKHNKGILDELEESTGLTP